MSKYYTGVGSRNTPGDIQEMMRKIGNHLYDRGWTLRSGGAKGADSAFEAYVPRKGKVIYRPHDSNDWCEEIAANLHPMGSTKFFNMSDFVIGLHGRNIKQVLGNDPERKPIPSKFLICWTKDAVKTHMQRSFDTGGTGTAISVADQCHLRGLDGVYGSIEVFNLADKVDYIRINKLLAT
ncbi:hypothetical protein KAR91_38685 [Candidatus Pacearchaeota archaeon]|nr:hypothetical protein [Candidatus Pacearchaeota archaeon]